MTSAGFRRAESGFTLLELMVAGVILAVLFMGFMSAMTGTFLADQMATSSNSSRAVATQLMEETVGLSYSDSILVDQNAVVLADGTAGKLAVLQVATNLVVVEVYVFRPKTATTAVNLAAMSMAAVKNLAAIHGSRVRLLCLKANR
jgi:prepilin-type N-terminal cleavage/methylation domain-containing protein